MAAGVYVVIRSREKMIYGVPGGGSRAWSSRRPTGGITDRSQGRIRRSGQADSYPGQTVD